jgi:zinc protease
MFLTILSESTFPKNEFDIQKNRTISSIIEEESDPSEIASNLFFKEMYGKHPYASPTNGLKNTVKKIQRKDVLNFYKKNINANTAKIAIVSPLAKNDIIKLVEKISKSLNHSKISGKPINTAIKKNKGKYIFKKSNSEQAHIYVGTLSIKRGSDNNFPLYVGNYIFGGSGFSARLMQELRVKRGLTYGVYSYVYPMKEIGPFVIGIETKSEQAQLSVKLIQDMVKDFYKKGPTEKELNDAKQAIINGFPLRIDSNSDILNYLSIINYYNLPIDYLSTFTSNISNLTKKDIISAFQEEIDIDNLITLVVGNEKAKKK